ncbi:sensor domain-containing diguanylate cyclase [Hyphococcus luteus]|nr:sensor domain-containing diguanylate cyclase [Marinicaulis flavus]
MEMKMMLAPWTGKSLRYWIAVGMSVAIAPLALSALIGFVLLNTYVVDPFHDVSKRERIQVAPIQNLRVLVWDTLIPVDEFVDEGGAQRAAAYRAARARIENAFAELQESLAGEPALLMPVERALQDWTEADRLATELVSVERPPGDPSAAEMMERFHGRVAAASDRLGVAYNVVAEKMQADHDRATRAYMRSQELALLAGVLSALAVIAGVVLIGRVMAASVDRLVDGAAKVSEGERDHRIDIRVPPELRRVADEFNRMIKRIEESESALAELARRDGLTGLLNRRAFDEALSEMYARMDRTGEEGALLTIDVDHFKRVNDTYGHSAGDDVLRAFATLATSSLRPFDQVYRVGGEEFSVLLPGTSTIVAHDLAERLRKEMARHAIATEAGEVSVTISIGGAKATTGLEPGKLIEAADAALYRAKTTGRNRVVLIDEFGAYENPTENSGKTVDKEQAGG